MTTETPFGSRYLLGEIVGRGAMGKVHRATSRDDEAVFAVKVLRDDLASQPEVVTRFIQERQVLRSVDHPNVVKVHDLVVEGDQLGIVMDFVSDGDLRRGVTWPVLPYQAVRLAAQIADGLAAIHAADVVHRDLKPENVLVERLPDGELLLRLTDFGVSRLVGHTITRITSLIGTPGYLAPEVAAGERPGPAADVYALGIILYEMLTGEPPFRAENPMALLRAHAEDAVPRPDGMPEPLWGIIESALDKDPAARPAAAGLRRSLEDVQAALVGLSAFEPVERGGTIYKASRTPRPAARDGRASLDETLDPSSVHDGGTVVTSRAPAAATPLDQIVSPAPPSVGSSRRKSIVAGVIAATIVLILGTLIVARGGGSDGATALAAETQPIRHAFAPVAYTGGVVVSRTWDLAENGDAINAKITFTHSGTERTETSHYEVIPKTVAADVSDIDFKPAPTEIVERDPVVRYDLSDLEAGETREVTWSVSIAAGDKTAARLEKLAKDQVSAEKSFGERTSLTQAVILAAITVDPADVSLTAGTTSTLVLTGTMSDGSPAPPAVLAGVAWSSTDPRIVEVTAGALRAIDVGIATIEAQAGDLIARTRVEVVRTNAPISSTVTTNKTSPPSSFVPPPPPSGPSGGDGETSTTSPPTTEPPHTDPKTHDTAPATTAAPTTTAKPTTTTTRAAAPTTTLTGASHIGDRAIRGTFTVSSAIPVTRCVLVVQGVGEFAGGCSQIDVGGLNYATTYTIYAYAENSSGRGSNSNSGQVRTNDPPPPRVISLSRGGAAPYGSWYSVSLSGFSPGSQVTVYCNDSRDRNFYTQTFTIDGGGRAGDSTLCYSADGPDHWVTSNVGIESNHVSW